MSIGHPIANDDNYGGTLYNDFTPNLDEESKEEEKEDKDESEVRATNIYSQLKLLIGRYLHSKITRKQLYKILVACLSVYLQRSCL